MAWNLLMAAVVFLPIYLLTSVVELKFRGVAFTEPFLYALSGAVGAYLGGALRPPGYVLMRL